MYYCCWRSKDRSLPQFQNHTHSVSAAFTLVTDNLGFSKLLTPICTCSLTQCIDHVFNSPSRSNFPSALSSHSCVCTKTHCIDISCCTARKIRYKESKYVSINCFASTNKLFQPNAFACLQSAKHVLAENPTLQRFTHLMHTTAHVLMFSSQIWF